MCGDSVLSLGGLPMDKAEPGDAPLSGFEMLAPGLPLLFAANVTVAWLGTPPVAGEALAQLGASGLFGLGIIDYG